MDERKLTRGVGLVSIGVGLALLAAPARTTRLFGMGERKELGYLLGARDLVLGAGLLSRRGDATFWLRARAFSDAIDAALLAGGALSGAFPRGRATLGFAAASAFSAFGFALAQRSG